MKRVFNLLVERESVQRRDLHEQNLESLTIHIAPSRIHHTEELITYENDTTECFWIGPNMEYWKLETARLHNYSLTPEENERRTLCVQKMLCVLTYPSSYNVSIERDLSECTCFNVLLLQNLPTSTSIYVGWPLSATLMPLGERLEAGVQKQHAKYHTACCITILAQILNQTANQTYCHLAIKYAWG
jgi:hypothetical protein